MKVIEVIRKYSLEDFRKTYRNQYGNSCDLMNLEKLTKMEVKSVSINFPTQEVTITIIEHAEVKKSNFKDIQNEVIKKYRIDICDGTRCKDGDWKRTHAHPNQRRVCKWKQANSIQSTFTLLHEIGHIETTKSGMRRAEEEYFATVWAIEECKRYGIEVPQKIIDDYQEYIDDEIDRGIRRGGAGYGKLKLI